MKVCFTVLSLFLLLILPFSAMADTGNIKVLDKNGNDITKDNFIETVKEKGIGGGFNDLVNSTRDTIYEKTGLNETYNNSIKAAQTAYEGALNGFSTGLVHSLFTGSVNLYDTDVQEEENGSVSYGVTIEKLSPYEHPLVLPVQAVSLVFLFLAAIITILGSEILYGFEEKNPEEYGEWKRTLSGEYVPTDPNRVKKACSWAVIRPIKGYVAYIGIIFIINIVIESLPQATSGEIAQSSNFFVALVTGLSLFLGALESGMAKYGFITSSILFFITYIITDIIVLFFKDYDLAKRVEYVFWGAFLVFCTCNLIMSIFLSIGVISSEAYGDVNWIMYGNVAGVTINLLLLYLLARYIVISADRKIKGYVI